jgi:hypothetical protein
MIRFIRTQYRLSCRAGFTPRKAIKRAVTAYINGFPY